MGNSRPTPKSPRLSRRRDPPVPGMSSDPEIPPTARQRGRLAGSAYGGGPRSSTALTNAALARRRRAVAAGATGARTPRWQAGSSTAARAAAMPTSPTRLSSFRYDSKWLWVRSMGATGKRKATFYLDEDVLRAARVRAARGDRRDSEIVEAALRAYLGFDVLERVWARSDLGEDEAMQLAVSELHAMRDEKRAARGS